MKPIKIILFAAALICASAVQAQKKQNLRILVVGGSPDFNTIGTPAKPDSMAVVKSARKRTADWTAMLKQYFTTVKAVQGNDYRQSMSDNYDVTIFDGKPKALCERRYIKNDKGEITGVVDAAYLTRDFSRPAVTIAEMGEDIGRSLGIKSDWYCLCLFGDALGWKADHQVFKGPFPVKLTTFMDNTPENALEIAEMFGKPLPAKTEMWKVQTRNYEKYPEMRIGMVSRPDGFGNPDDEVISSGRCAKSIDAVAIGRHGNFLHWGFAASPKDLTAQARQVFANAVVYISRFAGKPIARKLDERVYTRHWLDAKSYTDSRQGWEASNKTNDKFNHIVDSIKAVVKEKLAKGQKLSDVEKMYSNLMAQKNPTFEEYMKSREPELYKYFGTNTDLYVKYYEYNRPYFYAEGYDLKVDEDARELGIANNDKRLLSTCITMLEQGKDTARARRVLEHYTLCRFSEPQQWRKWYDTYKDKLFFTEGGGYLWLVNEPGDNVPGNDYSVLDAKTETPAPVITGKTTPANPVLVEGKLNDTDDGEKELVIMIKVHPGYHIYANVAKTDPFIPTDFKLELPAGLTKDGQMKLPPVKSLAGGATTVYDGECVFRQRLSGNGVGKVRCTVSYQCCDNTICLPPAEKVLEFIVK